MILPSGCSAIRPRRRLEMPHPRHDHRRRRAAQAGLHVALAAAEARVERAVRVQARHDEAAREVGLDRRRQRACRPVGRARAPAPTASYRESRRWRCHLNRRWSRASPRPCRRGRRHRLGRRGQQRPGQTQQRHDREQAAMHSCLVVRRAPPHRHGKSSPVEPTPASPDPFALGQAHYGTTDRDLAVTSVTITPREPGHCSRIRRIGSREFTSTAGAQCPANGGCSAATRMRPGRSPITNRDWPFDGSMQEWIDTA